VLLGRVSASGDKIRERGISGEVVIAECEGTVVATGALVGNEITGVFVRPGFQGRGIGGLVMDRLEQIARAAGHSTVELSVSLPSQGFYTGRGYRVIEDRSLDVGAGERLDYRAASKSIEG
jgi:GNAT superfamily N-acetyltransferase